MVPVEPSSDDTVPDGLDAAAEDLYGLAPQEFTADRDERAKAARSAGDRELAAGLRALRRPSVAAWAVNQLVRRHPDVVDQLLQLGSAMREAQLSLAGARLRALTTEQQGLTASVRRLVEQDAADCGVALSPSVGEQVVQTLRAALADEAAAAAVRSGRLTTHLEHTGFGPVDLDGAVAVPRAAPPARGPAAEAAEPPEPDDREERRERQEREDARRAAREALDEAGRAATRAADALQASASRADDAERDAHAAAEDVLDLERRLEQARHERDRAADAQRDAGDAREAAARAAREADAALQRARHHLETLPPPP